MAYVPDIGGEIPFGCRDCMVWPLTGLTPGTGVDVPRIRQVELSVTRDSAELEGDDVVVAVQTFAKKMEGSIEAGGINLAVLEVLEGGSADTTGTEGARISTYQVRGTDVEGYFRLEAQAIGNDGGDIHLVAYKVKATSGPTINFENGTFALTQCDIEAVFDTNSPSRLYDLVQNEAVTAIDSTPS
jgi:hypothetical protein